MIDSLIKLIKTYKSFFYLYGIFLFVGGFALVVYSKSESFFIVNSHYSVLGDTFFKNVTNLGDGLLFAIITLVLALYRYRLALLGLLVFLASSFVAQVLKHTLFNHVLRPAGYFGNSDKLHFVEGVSVYVNNSFPSGHATTAFALAFFMVLVFKLQKSGWLMAIIAILVGYSRVYLALHFPVDVYFGSLIGVVTTLFLYAWLDEPFKVKFRNKGLIKAS